MANATLGAWKPGNLPTNGQWNCLIYGNNLFVATSLTSPYICTSLDGITWTPRTAPYPQCSSVAYGNGVFVAIAISTGTNISTDGITWTISLTFPLTNAYSIVYGNGLFVALTNGGGCATSPDGITWTPRTVPSGSYRNSIYANGLFIATAYNQNFLITSPD